MNVSSTDDNIPKVYVRDDHIISRKNIDADALKIMRRLVRHGFRAYLVGGGVRDLLLEKRPKDFDIATDATPRKIKALFRNCRIIGRRFKLAHVYFRGGKIIEVSTFRDNEDEEGETPTTRSADELLITRDNVYGSEHSDALRRDLTINALFYDLSTFSIIDYVGGMEDLRNKVTRVIGEPKVRFAEDPVRLLRVVRHAVRAGFHIEESCQRALEENHELILNASQVRLFEEIKKDFCGGHTAKLLQALSKHKLLQHMLPELEEIYHHINREDSLLYQCLELTDALIKARGVDSATPVLALLAMFIAQPDALEPHRFEQLNSVDDVVRGVKSSFEKLAVPKKERERIISLLTYALNCRRETAIVKESQVPRGRPYDDLISLLSFLNIDDCYTSMLEYLRDIQKRRKSTAKKRKRRKRRNSSVRPDDSNNRKKGIKL